VPWGDLGIVVGLALLLTTLISGMPIFVSLGVTGAVGTVMFEGVGGLSNLGDMVFGSIWHHVLLAAPGFILMGNLFFHHDFGRDLFATADRWIGGVRGGLLIAAIWLGAMFAFICGSNMAGVATIGRIAIPEIERRGYQRALSMGALAIAGTLSVLIPPSLLMILYAVLTEVSLGDLFFAGIVPGILLTMLLSGYILLRATLDPAACPRSEPALWRERLRSLRAIAPVAITFLVVFGGIYNGIWSVIEASGAGAFMGLAFCLAYRRFAWRKFFDAVYGTVRILGMIYMIVIAATLFNYFIFVSKFDEILVALVSGLDLPGWLVIIAILVIMTALGCVFDLLAMILISIPIFLPIAVTAGYDPIWFGVILMIASELALVTPPVGLNLFIIKDLAPPGTTSAEVAMGAIPYVGVVWILFVLLTAFPGLALWLPSLAKGG